MAPRQGKKRGAPGRVLTKRKARRSATVPENKVSDGPPSQETQPHSVMKNIAPVQNLSHADAGPSNVPVRTKSHFRRTRRGSTCAPQLVTTDVCNDTPARISQENVREDLIPRKRVITESGGWNFAQEAGSILKVRGNSTRNLNLSSEETPEHACPVGVDEEEVNRLKNEVSDLSANLNRTRETLTASVEMYIKKVKELEKEGAQKDALCESLKRPYSDCKCSKSSALARRSNMDGIEETFQAVTRIVFDVLRDEASRIVRELVPVNGSVFRDWTGKVLKLPT